MKKAQLLELFDRELLIDRPIPGDKKETFPDLVRMPRESPCMNYVLYSKLGETWIDEAIDEQIAHFSRFEQPF